MRLILAGLLFLGLKTAAETLAEPDTQTQAKVGVVEEVCGGDCNKTHTPPPLTQPVKAKYKESVDTINQIDREVKKPEEIEKSKAKHEEPIGA